MEMYLQYFHNASGIAPYDSSIEAMEEGFAYLKLFLAGVYSQKELERNGSATEQYLSERELSESLKEAKAYIEERVWESSREYLEEENPARLAILCRRLKLSEFWGFLVLLAWGLEVNSQVEELFKILYSGRKSGADKRTAFSLCRISGIKIRPDELADFTGEAGMFQILFPKAERGGNLFLRPSLLSFLLEGKTGREFHLLSPQKPLEPLWLYHVQKEQIIKLLRLDGFRRGKEARILYLNGRKGCGKRFCLSHACQETKSRILLADFAGIPRGEEAGAACLEELYIQAKLENAIPCVAGFYEKEPLTGEPGEGQKTQESLRSIRLFDKIKALGGLWILTGKGKEGFLGSVFSIFVNIEFPAPSASEKAILWKELLKIYPGDETVNPVLNGNKYVLNTGELKQVLETAGLSAESLGRPRFCQKDVEDALKVHSRGTLGSLAVLVPSVFSWEDLVVSQEVKEGLLHICNQVKYRNVVGDQWGFYKKTPYGRGISALLYGPPGTGKTMAVQVVAGELGMDLYRVDMSQMVSKYIGETEKNITSLFDKARHMNVILFFDEADAFFSQRSQVKDANDRNANGEVAHLLQKMEEYQGVILLATNMKEQIDDAFKRRIRFMIDFRFPDGKTRRELWRKILPEAAPREEDLDLDFFAEEFELSGSQIKEVLQNAAFMAAAKGRAIGNDHIKEAMKLNYAKYGKVLTKEDFGYLG